MNKTVKEAALLMDGLKPGWYKGVNTDSLNMSCITDCILGQVFGDYEEALDDHGIEDCYERAFSSSASDIQIDWVAEIERRLKPGIKVVDKRRGNKVRYDSLAQGAVFTDDGVLLVKTRREEDEDIISVCINDGEMYTYGGDDLVTPVSVELHLVD